MITNCTSTKISILALLVLSFTSCNTISPYNENAYLQVTSCKAECLLLMDKATTPYAENAEQIERVHEDLLKAYEFDKGRPLNQITVKLWDVLLDPARDLWGGFLRDWKAHDHMGTYFIEQKKNKIAEAFDQISGLESGKNKTP